jgi:hypothetical protein
VFNDIAARVTDDITDPISTEEWWNVATLQFTNRIRWSSLLVDSIISEVILIVPQRHRPVIGQRQPEAKRYCGILWPLSPDQQCSRHSATPPGDRILDNTIIMTVMPPHMRDSSA